MNKTKTRKQDIYERVTARILEALEKGVVPWTKPWTEVGAPMNAVSKKPYRGINRVLLGLGDFGSPFWMTYKQAKSLGGHVKKGEKGTTIVFWRFVEKEEEEDGEIVVKTIPILRHYTVFNAEQCELPEGALPTLTVDKPTANERIAEAERIVEGMPKRPKIKHGGDRAFYRPATDTVHVPALEAFVSPEHYYTTLFHELVHSTGAEHRLNRPGIAEFDFFGSHQYSDEELVAEFGASFLCGHAGIENTVEHSAAYISHWADRLREPKNKRLIVFAAARAQKAADFILGEQKQEDNDNEE